MSRPSPPARPPGEGFGRRSCGTPRHTFARRSSSVPWGPASRASTSGSAGRSGQVRRACEPTMAATNPRRGRLHHGPADARLGDGRPGVRHQLRVAAGRRLVGAARDGPAGGSQRTGSERGLRKMTPEGAVAPSSSRRPGQPSSTASSAASVSSLARCSPTQACGPWANATCVRAFGPRDVERVGFRIGGRIPVGRRQRHDDEVAARDPRPAELDVRRGIPIDPRSCRLEANDSSTAFGPRVRSARRAAS